MTSQTLSYAHLTFMGFLWRRKSGANSSSICYRQFIGTQKRSTSSLFKLPKSGYFEAL